MNKEAANFEAIYKAIESHGLACDAPPTGVEMSYFDIERMGWEEGDVIAGLPLSAGAQAGMIHILCDAEGSGNEEHEETVVDAVSKNDRLVTV